MGDRYEITEEDIEVALKFLHYHDAENATREKAIALLQDLQTGFHDMAHNNPDLLLKLQKELGERKNSEDSTA